MSKLTELQKAQAAINKAMNSYIEAHRAYDKAGADYSAASAALDVAHAAYFGSTDPSAASNQ